MELISLALDWCIHSSGQHHVHTSDRIGHGEDAALATLLLPFANGGLAWPQDGHVLFVHARDGAWLHEAPRDRLLCMQGLRFHFDALQRRGVRVIEQIDDERFPLVLLLPPRQSDQARADLARAAQCLVDGGVLVASASNNEGARSREADMRRLFGSANSLSKNHCRVFRATLREDALDRALLEAWLRLDASRPIAEGRFLSRPGVFAWDRIDAGSALLAAHLPGDLSGCIADLGAGYGYLSVELLEHCPRIVSIDLYEADARAIDLARSNAARANAARANAGRGQGAKLDWLWHDVTSGLPRSYDAIVTNPPFHQSRSDAPELGQAFIAAAAMALVPGGRLWLVANQHLPYESVLNERFAKVRTIVVKSGYKILEAIR